MMVRVLLGLSEEGLGVAAPGSSSRVKGGELGNVHQEKRTLSNR